MFRQIAVLSVFSLFAVTALGQGTSTFPTAGGATDRESARPHIGVTTGIIEPEGSYRPVGELGLDIGFQPYIPFGFGAELTRSTTDNDVGQDLERTSLLLKGTYHLGGDIPVIKNAYFGLGVGSMFEPNETRATLAPLAGFDIPLTEDQAKFFSLGLGAKYLIVDGSNPDVLALNGMLKYWF